MELGVFAAVIFVVASLVFLCVVGAGLFFLVACGAAVAIGKLLDGMRPQDSVPMRNIHRIGVKTCQAMDQASNSYLRKVEHLLTISCRGGDHVSRKKDDNVLDLGPLAADLGSTNMCPMPVSSRWVLTRDEELMIEEDRKQQLAIELGAVKGRFGASKIVEVHQHATLIFDETTGVIMDIKDRPGRTQQHQAYIDQFSEREIQVLAQHLLGVINVTATDIATEIHKSPYPSPEPEPPAKYGRRKGFLRRLLGYGE